MTGGEGKGPIQRPSEIRVLEDGDGVVLVTGPPRPPRAAPIPGDVERGQRGHGELHAVAEGRVPEVMTQGRHAHTAAELLPEPGPVEVPVPIGVVEGLAREMEHAQAVAIAGVRRPRKGQIGKARLPDIAQPLDPGIVHDGNLVPAQRNAAVNRVSDLQPLYRPLLLA